MLCGDADEELFHLGSAHCVDVSVELQLRISSAFDQTDFHAHASLSSSSGASPFSCPVSSGASSADPSGSLRRSFRFLCAGEPGCSRSPSSRSKAWMARYWKVLASRPRPVQAVSSQPSPPGPEDQQHRLGSVFCHLPFLLLVVKLIQVVEEDLLPPGLFPLFLFRCLFRRGRFGSRHVQPPFLLIPKCEGLRTLGSGSAGSCGPSPGRMKRCIRPAQKAALASLPPLRGAGVMR